MKDKILIPDKFQGVVQEGCQQHFQIGGHGKTEKKCPVMKAGVTLE